MGWTCWMTLRKSREQYRFVWLLQAVISLLLLLLLLLWAIRDRTNMQRWESCEGHRPEMKVDRLPPVPESDDEMLQALFKHLTEANGSACKRNAWLGGEAIMRTNTTPMLWGLKQACFDPEFGLADGECLVYSVRDARDASFDRDAHAFGCETHSFGQDGGPSAGVEHHTVSLEHALSHLDELTAQLAHTNRMVSYLALTLDTAALAALTDVPPHMLTCNVRQLGMRLDLRAFTTGVWGSWPEDKHDWPVAAPPRDLHGLRRVYASLLQLQRLGFYPFEFDQLDSVDVGEFAVPGMQPIPDQLEVAWVKSSCLDE